MLWIAMVAWHAAQAPTAPPPPQSAASPRTTSPWSCTRETLLVDTVCTFDGRGGPRAPGGASESARDAATLLREVCAEVTRVGAAPEPTAMASCVRSEAALASACDHVGAPLRDASGRFNPGHARCYAALRGAIADATEDLESARGCCACAAAKCGMPMASCHARLGQRKALEGACAQRCAPACAEAAARAALTAPTKVVTRRSP